jgi:exodeoxyribonuclease-3
VKLATWNVNGIRAREAQVLAFVEREQPDIVCLQEIKAPPARVPASLCALDGYWCLWHGETAYSGVAMLVTAISRRRRPRSRTHRSTTRPGS